MGLFQAINFIYGPNSGPRGPILLIKSGGISSIPLSQGAAYIYEACPTRLCRWKKVISLSIVLVVTSTFEKLLLKVTIVTFQKVKSNFPEVTIVTFPKSESNYQNNNS